MSSYPPCQVFRSIDSGSVKGFPKDVKEAEAQVRISSGVSVDFSYICCIQAFVQLYGRLTCPLLQNLVCGKNLQVDRSIHTAYVKAIRSAQHFIYIENQYFLGSSYNWPSHKHAGGQNAEMPNSFCFS